MTSKRLSRSLYVVGLMAVAVALCGCGNRSQPAPADNTIVIGWTAWGDAEFVTRLASTVIEASTDHRVRLKLAGIGKQYQGVAQGRLDAMLMAWLPDTQARYWSQYRDQLVDLGPLYGGGRLGWLVPEYVPRDRLNSIADLADPDIAARLGHRIQGIDPRAGLMQLSENALNAYGLADQYRLVAGDGNTMSQALGAAEAVHRWVVVTGWRPHWIFGEWPLRFLKDSQHVLGASQHIDVLVREGFRGDYPQVAAMLAAMHLSLSELQAAMFDAEKNGYPAAIQHFMDQHSHQVASWVAAGKPD